jgi:TPR repeat protein
VPPQNASNTGASTSEVQRTAARAAYFAGGHGGFRPTHAFTRPAHLSLRERLRATSALCSQGKRSEAPRSSRRSFDHVQPHVGIERNQQVHANRRRSLPEDPDAFAFGRLAGQARVSESETTQTRAPRTTAVEQLSDAGVMAPAPQLRLTPESESLSRMLVDALLMLGYLHLDGEGTKRDNREAVSAMRRASELGSDEARRTLGWMYNTGQFGE